MSQIEAIAIQLRQLCEDNLNGSDFIKDPFVKHSRNWRGTSEYWEFRTLGFLDYGFTSDIFLYGARVNKDNQLSMLGNKFYADAKDNKKWRLGEWLVNTKVEEWPVYEHNVEDLQSFVSKLQAALFEQKYSIVPQIGSNRVANFRELCLEKPVSMAGATLQLERDGDPLALVRQAGLFYEGGLRSVPLVRRLLPASEALADGFKLLAARRNGYSVEFSP